MSSQPARLSSLVLRYLASILCVAVIWLVVRFFIVDPHYPYLFFFLAVIIAALLGGLGPGLLAMTGGLLVGNFFFAHPPLQFSLQDPVELVNALHYLIVSGITVGLIQGLHFQRDRTRQAEAEARLRARRAELEILERRRVEEALRLSQDRLELALEAGRMGIWDWDVSTGRVAWSPGMESIHGLEPGVFGGKWEHATRDIHPEDRDHVLAAINKVLKDGRDYLSVYRIVRPDGSIVWVEVQGRLTRDIDGNPARMTGMCLDITKRKQAEEALLHSQHRYRALLEAYSECVWIWNPTTNEGDRNGVKWWMELTGMTREQMRNDGWMRAIHEEDRSRAQHKWMQAMTAGTSYDDEFRVLARDGEYRHVQSRAVPIYNDQGRVREWCGTLVDVTARRRAEQALRESERRLDAVLASIDDHLMTFDPQWRCTYVNDKAASVIGCARSDLVGKRLLDVAPHLQGSQLFQELTLAFAEQRALRSEHYDAALDKWFEDHIYPSPEGVTVFSSDITWRKNAQKALRESEERFRLALKAAPIMIYHYDRELRYTWAYNTHPSYPADSLLGKTDAEIVPGPIGEHLMRIKRPVLQTGQGARDEVQIELDGVLRTFDLMIEPMRDAQGAISGVTVAAVDITQRKQMEEALQASEREFRAVFELAAAGKIQCDPADFRFLRVNRKFQQMIGYTETELRQRTLLDVLHPDDRAEREQQLLDLVEGNVREVQIETRLTRKDGQVVWASLAASVIRSESGAVMRTIASVQDITERKMFELELTRHRERLEEIIAQRTAELEQSHQRLRLSERMTSMGTLSAGLAHDMGNLLLPLKFRLDVLQSMDLPTAAHEHLTAIQLCAKHLQGLVQGLRLFSREPEQDDEQDQTNLAEWCRDTRGFFAGLLPQTIQLTFDIPAHLPPVKISAHALTQIGLNLVNNARESIGPQRQGHVVIQACATSDRKSVRLTVSDDGPGMSPQVRARAVEPFFTTKTRSLSTGLGLSMVHGLVTAVGGQLEIHSPVQSSHGNLDEPAGGAAIVLILPAVETVQPQVEASGDDSGRIAAVSLSDPRTQAIVTTMLMSMGYRVHQVSNGQPGDCSVWLTEPCDERIEAARTFLASKPDGRVIVVGEPPESWRELPVQILDGSCRPSALRAALSGAPAAESPAGEHAVQS